jgi:hypothetical protein
MFGINPIKPKLKILENETSYIGAYSPSKNEITFSKGSIKSEIYDVLEFLSHKEIKGSISNIRYRILQ